MPCSLDITVPLPAILGQARGGASSAVGLPEVRWCGHLGMGAVLCVYVYRTVRAQLSVLLGGARTVVVSLPDAKEASMNVLNSRAVGTQAEGQLYLFCSMFLCPISLPPVILMFLRMCPKGFFCLPALIPLHVHSRCLDRISHVCSGAFSAGL